MLSFMEQGVLYDQLSADSGRFWAVPNMGGPNGVNIDGMAGHSVNTDGGGPPGVTGQGVALNVLPAYLCPSDILPLKDNNGFGKTNYCGNLGNWTWGGTWPNWGCAAVKGTSYNGIFPYSNDNVTTTNSTMADVVDGTSTTISVGEVSLVDPTWVGPNKTDDGAFPIWAGGNNERGCGDIYGLASFLRLINVDFYINRRIGPQSLLSFGSLHPGGAQFAFVDGSTHFLSQDVDVILYQSLGSRNRGEAVTVP